MVAAAYKEVSNYQDLLLLGDLATITQEKRPYSWISGAPTLSPEAQTALTTSLLGLTLKLTGAKLANFKLKLPGGKMRAKSRPEVVAYLALIQVCRQHNPVERRHSFFHSEHRGPLPSYGRKKLCYRKRGGGLTVVFYSVHNPAPSTSNTTLPSTTTPPTQHPYVHYKV